MMLACRNKLCSKKKGISSQLLSQLDKKDQLNKHLQDQSNKILTIILRALKKFGFFLYKRTTSEVILNFILLNVQSSLRCC